MNGHSMHFHGVEYKPSSDGAYVPGVSGPDGNVLPGRTWTYRLTAGAQSVGAWPYHDHSPSMHESIDGGMYGMLSIRGRDEALPDREFVVVFAAMGDFQTIDGRAFVGNTPVFRAKRRRPRPMGRHGDGLRAPHLPRPRPSLAARPAGSVPRHAYDRPGGVLPLPLARARPWRLALPLPCRAAHGGAG